MYTPVLLHEPACCSHLWCTTWVFLLCGDSGESCSRIWVLNSRNLIKLKLRTLTLFHSSIYPQLLSPMPNIQYIYNYPPMVFKPHNYQNPPEDKGHRRYISPPQIKHNHRPCVKTGETRHDLMVYTPITWYHEHLHWGYPSGCPYPKLPPSNHS